MSGVLGAAYGASEAKVPGAVHCYNAICHHVRTVRETEARVGIIETLVASFYDAPDRDRFNPRLETSSGERFEADADDNAASPIHPDGTILLIWSPTTRAAALVRINNAGPYYPGRTLDVSHGVADRMGFGGGGVMRLVSVVIAAPLEPEARYVRGRVYPKVPGYLGNFETLELASLGARGFAPQIEISDLRTGGEEAAVQGLPSVSTVATGSMVVITATKASTRSFEKAVHEPVARIRTVPAPADQWQRRVFEQGMDR